MWITLSRISVVTCFFWRMSFCHCKSSFSGLLDEGIPKIWNKLNSHSGFLRRYLVRAKMCCQIGWIGCATLQVTQKDIVRIQFLSYFWNQVYMKNIVKYSKHFLGYFNTLETDSVLAPAPRFSDRLMTLVRKSDD